MSKKLACGGLLKGGLRFSRIEKKTQVLRPALQSNQSSLCGLHYSGTEKEEDQIVSMKRAADGRGRDAGRSLFKREKSTGPRTDPSGTPPQTLKERLL